MSGQQVAEICHTNESTIHYFARLRMLQGRQYGNSWHFLLSDALNFCEDWRYEQSKRWRARAGGNRLRRGLKRLASFGLNLLNIVSGGVSLAAAAGLDRAQFETWIQDWLGSVLNERVAAAQTVTQINDIALQVVQSEGYRREAVVLAALNFLGPVLHMLRGRFRRPSRADMINGESVDPAAVSWHLNCWAVPLLRGFQVACVVATVAYVAMVPSSPAESPPPVIYLSTSTPVPTTPPQPSPTPVATVRLIGPPTVTPPITFPSPTPFMPPATIPPSPTATALPPTATVPPTATATVPPTATATVPPPPTATVPAPLTSCAPPGNVAANDWPGGVTQDAALRSGPGLDCPILRILAQGEEVAVRTVPYGEDGVSWVMVDTGLGETGWVDWLVLRDLSGPD